MATPYIHNTTTYSSPEFDPASLIPHKRNNSTNSGGTTLLGSSDYSHSQPTEPLLQRRSSDSVVFFDTLRQVHRQSGSIPEWAGTTSMTGSGDHLSARERRSRRDHELRERLRRLQWGKRVLGGLITAFSVYFTVRYFLAFTVYETVEGQATSLSLGISTGMAFALTVCATAVWLFQPYLLVHDVSLVLLLNTRTAFHSAASFGLFAPAVVNTVMLFLWENSSNDELNVRNRCHIDIDVIWSVSSSTAPCKPPAWSIWVALTILRLVITIIILRSSSSVLGFISLDFYTVYPRSPTIPLPKQAEQSPYSSSIIRIISWASPSVIYDRGISAGFRASPPNPTTSIPPSVHSDDDTVAEYSQHTKDSQNNVTVASDDYNEHFRALVSEIHRETEDALTMAASDYVDTHTDADVGASPVNGEFPLYRIPPAVGYDEFGRPYPPDIHIPMLNGYVRRMPTIESMGSREMGSLTSSIYSHDTRTTSLRSSLPISRPPTRATNLDTTFGSRPPSSTNSITAGAEILLAAGRTNEMGELVGTTSHIDLRAGTGSSGSSNPTSMLTYYTAGSHGSASSDYPPTQ
ncbi:hypothetical protein H0H92_012242 [Tricholoma furcatifolium]|nr:hypothetical protein H0H92_012242 [Tricholoma furcatifolium]